MRYWLSNAGHFAQSLQTSIMMTFRKVHRCAMCTVVTRSDCKCNYYLIIISYN